MKKANRFLLFAALLLLASVLSACGGTPAAQSWPGLAADEKAAYLANGSVVYAVRLKDGEELWSFPEDPGTKLIFYANPVFTSDGNIVVGSSGTEHSLFILDAETGTADWSFSDAEDHWVASPLVAGDMLYAPNADGFLYAFDLSKTGDDKLAWKVDLGGKLWSSPVADEERVYVASLDHHLHAINITTHEIDWVADLNAANTGAPVVANDLVIVGSFSDSLAAFHAADGSPAWNAPTKGWIWANPIVYEETIYAVDMDGNFYTLNLADGTSLADTIRPDGAVIAAPAFNNGRVLLATENGTLYAITSDGNLDTLETWDAKLYTAPVVAGELTLVAPFRGDFLLIALDQDGQKVWQYPKEEK